jgi:hypothetical protein
MSTSFLQVILFLLAGIASIIVLTVRFRVHPFFALLIACFVTGLGIQLGVPEILNLMKAGFGDIMSKLAIIIVLGTTIGVLLGKKWQHPGNGCLYTAGSRTEAFITGDRYHWFYCGAADLLRFRLYCIEWDQ